MTEPVVTFTPNPVIDSSCETDRIFPTQKVRTQHQRYDPGGGGINVARVLSRMGDAVRVSCMAGGATGGVLCELLGREELACHVIPVSGHTRINHAVFERTSALEYRFVGEGPVVSEAEWRAALDYLTGVRAPWLVASGSLPRGCPADFYARLSHGQAGTGARLVLDTSGPALAEALEEGGFFLAKPSQDEFEALAGRTFASPHDVGEAALDYVRRGKVLHLAVTLGAQGAVLAHPGGVEVLAGLPVEARSATGAGDSFVGGMVHGFLTGGSGIDAFRWGLAAGSAAVLSPGTGLCDPGDVRRLLDQIVRK